MYDFTDIPDDEYVMAAMKEDGDDDQPMDEWQDMPYMDAVEEAVNDLNTGMIIRDAIEECPIACNGCGHWMLAGRQITCLNCPAPDKETYRLDKLRR